MRKLIVCNIVSLDGYFTGPDANVMLLPMDGAFDAYNLERLAAADTVLLGHRSYQLFSSFWPAVADNPEASPENRAFSRRYNAIEKVVVSHNLKPEDVVAPWQATTCVVGSEVHERVADLKRQSGKDIVIFGSGDLWNDLLAHGLVDELHLMVGAVALGAGVPVFKGFWPSLALLDTRTWEGSNNVLLCYDTGQHVR